MQNLSLSGLQVSNAYFEQSILCNDQTLTVLDLNGCKGLSLEIIINIVFNCLQLTEINLDNTKLDSESITYLCKNLTNKIEKLSLFRLKVTDENIRSLVENCKNITELDLGATNVTEVSVITIIEALGTSLVKLRLPNYIEFTVILGLRCIPSLKYLWFRQFSSIVHKLSENEKSALMNNFPNVKINHDFFEIAKPDHLTNPMNGFWEIDCKQTLFTYRRNFD